MARSGSRSFPFTAAVRRVEAVHRYVFAQRVGRHQVRRPGPQVVLGVDVA